MPRFAIDRDPFTDAVQTFEYDEAEDRAILATATDVEPVIDHNKRLANDWQPRRGEVFRHVASIPLALVDLWRQLYGIDVLKKGHEKEMFRLLNDPDLRHLRIWPGRL